MNLAFFRNKFSSVILAVVAFLVCLVGAYCIIPSELSVGAPIYKAENNGKVSLMVNVYWGNQYIPEMLEIFAVNNVKTTFFVGGTWAENNEDLLKDIYNAGHEIANHGYFHKDHKKLSKEQNRQEIVANHNLIRSILGVEMNLFSPPSASFSDVTLNVAEQLGYTTIMYSKDTIDWRDQDKDVILRRATKNIEGGDLVLMHPTAATVAILPQIIVKIKEKGLILSTVSDIIGNK